MIGVLLNFGTSNPNSGRLSLLEMRFRSLGYHLMVMHEDLFPEPKANHIRNRLEEFKSRGVDGLICVQHTNQKDPLLIPRLVDTYFHQSAIFLEQPADTELNYVGCDWVDGARQAVDYLVNQGRSRIALTVPDLDWYAGPRQKQGYIEGLQGNSLPVQEDLIWVGNLKLTDNPQHLSQDMAMRIVEEFIIPKKVDAIVAAHDHWAGQLILCLKEKGYSIPENIAVVGWGNTYFVNYTRPTLTSIDLQNDRVAYLAAETLVNMLESNSGKVQQRTLIKPELIVRESA
jgi:LacI family transcriptional regulator